MDITFYDSLDDMFEAEDKARKKADESVREWQKKLKKGDYFVKDSGLGFPIFGKILGEYKEEKMKNYRFCDCYSIACPDGEKGDVHVSGILSPLSEDDFNLFKERGWKVD